MALFRDYMETFDDPEGYARGLYAALLADPRVQAPQVVHAGALAGYLTPPTPLTPGGVIAALGNTGLTSLRPR